MKKIGVIGLGNPLRQDDGIGLLLLNKLIEKKNQFPEHIEFIDGGTGGMKLLHLLARFDRVIVIDAINFNGEAGESKSFTIEEVIDHENTTNLSTHESDFSKILQLSKELKEIPQEVHIYGIQPKDTNFGEKLSIELKEKIDSYLNELTSNIFSIN